MPVLNATTQIQNVNKFGLEGLNTFDDPSDIDDIELADTRNMVFDNGTLQNRKGSLLYASIPAGETNAPSQFLVAKNSVGNDFMITVYGNNFYLWDTNNNQWIKLNHAYTPSMKNLFYGSANWNHGTSDDRFYFGNGAEDTMKWTMAISTLSVAANAGDGSLYLNDSTTFPGNPAAPFAFESNTTISFVAASREINDSSNGFLDAGFRSGMSINVVGSVSNDNQYTIYSVTEGTIVVKENTLTDESAGNSIAISQIGIALIQGVSAPFTLYYGLLNITYTNDTIAFTSPHTITDSSNQFISEGFKVGQKIFISGTELNNLEFTITAVTAGTITVNEPIQTELAGQQVTIVTPTLTLIDTVGQNVPAGATVVTPIVDMGAMPQGKVILVSQGNLFLLNYVESENTVNYSRLGDPENFTITTGDANTAGFYTIYHGKGGIINASDFGEYLLIEKEDVLLQWIFSINSSGDQTVSVNPVISGDGIGPVSQANSLNYMNILYYPTSAQGIISFEPQTTGQQTTSGLDILSQKINNLVTNVFNFNFSKTCGLAQKLYWCVSLPIVGVSSTVNNLVLVYDLVRASQNPNVSAWTFFDNWNAVDIKPVNDILYYFSANDGAVYQCYSGYQDAQSNNPIPYTSFALSKRFNLGQPAQLTRVQYIYLEGFLSLNTTFYVRVLFNENGSLGSQSYAISGTNSVITGGAFTAGLGRFVLASPVLGGIDLFTLQQLQNPLFFRCYLETTQAYRPHNVQVQPYSVAIGSQFGITKMSIFTQPEQSIETPLVLSPAAAPMIQL